MLKLSKITLNVIEENLFKMLTPFLGLPTTEGNTAVGASFPLNPALIIPDPLSITNVAPSFSAMFPLIYGCVSFLRFKTKFWLINTLTHELGFIDLDENFM